METQEKLNQLSELRYVLSGIEVDKQKMIDSILTPEIRQQIKDIEDEFAPEFEKAQEAISKLELNIKADVLENRSTIQGNKLEAVFCKGRVSWDTKGLDEAIKILPQLEQYRNEGLAYVTIRERKGQK